MHTPANFEGRAKNMMSYHFLRQELTINTVQRLLLKDDERNEDNEPSVADILELRRFYQDTMFTFNGRSRAHPWDPRYRG